MRRGTLRWSGGRFLHLFFLSPLLLHSPSFRAYSSWLFTLTLRIPQVERPLWVLLLLSYLSVGCPVFGCRRKLSTPLLPPSLRTFTSQRYHLIGIRGGAARDISHSFFSIGSVFSNGHSLLCIFGPGVRRPPTFLSLLDICITSRLLLKSKSSLLEFFHFCVYLFFLIALISWPHLPF